MTKFNARRRRALEVRHQVENGIREFFLNQGFLETRTPTMVRSPGMEPHIRPFRVANHARPDAETGPTAAFLHTSPEFAMKKLLARGLEKIYQIATVYRDEPVSSTHLPEFTMLEWYRVGAKTEDIMRDCEGLLAHVAAQVPGAPRELAFGDARISLQGPWPRLRTRDLFLEHAGVDWGECATVDLLSRECRRLGVRPDASDTWDDLYFKIWLNVVEPRLPANTPAFVTRYPASQAALSVIDTDPDGSRWANRFELYAGGLELANAFQELTDPVEQRRRFEEDMRLRARIYGTDFPASPIDEEFIAALEMGLPPCSGIALGVDRLVMLFSGETDVRETVWIEPFS